MFGISHAYIVNKVLGRSNGLLMLGCILPDIRVVTSDESPLDNLHEEPIDFYNFLKEKHPELLDLGLSVRLHCAHDKGADYYSDDEETGYALLKAAPLKGKAGQLIGDDSRNALVLGHNFIEWALEMKIQEHDKNIGQIYQTGLNEVDYEKVSKCVAEYFGMNVEEIQENLQQLVSRFSLANLSNPSAFAKLFQAPIQKRYGAVVEDLDQLISLEKESEAIVESDYLDLFNRAIAEIKMNINSFSS